MECSGVGKADGRAKRETVFALSDAGTASLGTSRAATGPGIVAGLRRTGLGNGSLGATVAVAVVTFDEGPVGAIVTA